MDFEAPVRAATVRLASDPLYQLSTAGQELFHTNMLYWLARNHPAAAQPVWKALGVGTPPAGAKVRREHHNIDLLIDGGAGARDLVLENKVSAVATADQLKGYHEKLASTYADDATAWRLLTLLQPTFDPPAPWQHMTYAGLVSGLRTTADALSGRNREIVAAYADLVGKLVELADSADPAQSLDGPVFYGPELNDELREARAYSLVAKLQMSRCAELLKHRCAHLIPPGNDDIEVGLTNGQALLAWTAPGPKRRRFGWQIQGLQMRYSVVVGPGDPRKRAKREELVEREHLDYYEEAELPERLSTVVGTYAQTRKPWLGYEPDFVYRYRKINPSATWKQLLDLLEWSTEDALAYTGQHPDDRNRR